MPVIRIQNFGGEIPRLPARALPAGAASVNANLLATATDFRPVTGCTDVAPADNGAVTLYRKQKDAAGALLTSEAAGWLSSTADISYVRGQLMDDAYESTYLTDNSGATAPRVISSQILRGVPVNYKLGVPAPAKPSVARLGLPRFTHRNAIDWMEKTLVPAVSAAIGDCLVEDQASSRFTDMAGNKLTTGGVYGKTVAGVTEFVPGPFQYFPTYQTSQRGLTEPWNIMMRIPAAYAPTEGMGHPDLGGVARYDPADGSSPIWIGVSGLPLWGVLDKTLLATKLAALKSPRDATVALWSASQVALLVAGFAAVFSTATTDLLAKRKALDEALREFIAAGYNSIQQSTKPVMPIAPASVGEETYQGGFDGQDTLYNPAWPEWNEANKAYLAAKEVAITALADWKTKQAGYVAQMLAAQAKSVEISHEIEAMYIALKAGLSDALTAFFSRDELIKTDARPDGLVAVDSDEPKETVFYLATWVTARGEESAPSEPSEALEIQAGEISVIQRPAMPADLVNDRNITAWRLYRSNSGSAGAAFQFDAEMLITDKVKAPVVATGSTDGYVTGVPTTGKWRDIVATWMIYQMRGIVAPGTAVDFYLDTSKLEIGDTATQSNATGYSMTKTWNGAAWSIAPVAAVTSLVGSLAHLDGLSAAKLGEVCPSLTWLPPPTVTRASGAVTHLKGLTAMANGVMVGFIDNFLAPCEPYVPYAYPVEYQIPLSFPIVGLCAFGSSMLVGTMGNPYLVSGADSASLSAQILEFPQACVSRRSMVAGMGGVFYASPDGYCHASQNGVENVTQALFSREDWQKLNPASIFAVIHDGVLYFWYSGNGGGCYGLDFAAQKLTRHDIAATAVFADVVSDSVYVASTGKVRKLFSPLGTRSTGRWVSGTATLPAQKPFAWLKVFSEFEAGAVTVKWWGDGVLRHTAVITSTSPVRLPPGRYLEHVVEVSSMSRVTAVALAGSTEELQSE